jgi:hypothetical protein
MSSFLPASLRPSRAALLPSDPATREIPSLPRWFAGAYLVLMTARSLVHLFSVDGGAASIATVDVSVQGGTNIIAIFGQWGAIQLLLALLLWTLLVRYRGLTPLVLLALLVEPVLRGVSGTLKPLETVGTAPGAALNWVVVPIIVVMLWISLCPARTPSQQDEAAPRHHLDI